jgi:hypothetical protein
MTGLTLRQQVALEAKQRGRGWETIVDELCPQKTDVCVEMEGAEMSYFNEEQQSEMRYLASLKPAEKCWCGWFPAGKCSTPNSCAPEHTMADRLKVTCACGNYPHKPGGRMIHRLGCEHEFDTGQGAGRESNPTR